MDLSLPLNPRLAERHSGLNTGIGPVFSYLGRNYVHVHVHVNMYVCVCVYMFIYRHTHMFMYIFTPPTYTSGNIFCVYTLTVYMYMFT